MLLRRSNCHQMLASVNNDVGKACQMIAKAQALMSKADPVQRTMIARLEHLTTKSIHIQELESGERKHIGGSLGSFG